MYKELKDKNILITGATGLIGQAFTKRLISAGAHIIAIVRNLEKGISLFGETPFIKYIVSDVTQIETIKMEVDYIIHAASNTSSKAFLIDPVGIINTAYEGTKRTLDIARLSNVKGYVYLSSMEVYGNPATDEKIDELHWTNLDTLKPRSAYPESKRICESLCASYASQYNVPAKVIRLTQTFGPEAQYNDNRVFAEFARCAIENRDIILHTKGETRRSYLYTEDAVDAILTVLLRGEKGQAYNAANEETYCSIYEMAEMVANECAKGKIKVIVEEENIEAYGYAPTLHLNLDTRKIQKIGWKPTTDLVTMYDKMIAQMRKKKPVDL